MFSRSSRSPASVRPPSTALRTAAILATLAGGAVLPAAAVPAIYVGSDATGAPITVRVEDGRVLDVRGSCALGKETPLDRHATRSRFAGCSLADDGSFRCFQPTLCKVGEPAAPSLEGRLSADGERLEGTFGCCFMAQAFTATRTKLFGHFEPQDLPRPSAQQTAGEVGCTGDEDTLCLNESRFTAEISWERRNGETGVGRVQEVPQDDSGLFWFFNADNLEMLIKVLNGCGVNDRYWVFFSAGTNVGFTLNVKDLKTGETKVYTNPVGTVAPPVADTSAFATCP